LNIKAESNTAEQFKPNQQPGINHSARLFIACYFACTTTHFNLSTLLK